MTDLIEQTGEMLLGMRDKLEEAWESQTEIDSLYGTYFIGKDEFAFHIREMQEVVNYPKKVDRLPLMPDYVEGVFNLRTKIVPLVNLRRILGIAAQDSGTLSTYVGIIKISGQLVGVELDRTGDVLTLEDDDIAKVERKSGSTVIAGLANLDGGQRIIRVIAATSILEMDDMPVLSQKIEEHRESDIYGVAQGGLGMGETAISFTSDRSEFAVPVGDILEVLEHPKLEDTHVPYDNCLGILNLRGTLISVIDFRSAMGSDSYTDIETGMVLVVIADSKYCGFLVDNVTDVFDYHESRVIAIPGLKENKRKGCLRGVVSVSEDRNVFLVDSKALCKEDDILESIEASTVPDAFDCSDGGSALGRRSEAAEQDELKVYITFRLGKTLAAEISEVDEIIAFPNDLMEPPGYNGYIRGMLSLRGSIIPIVDMRRYYGMDDYADIAESSVLIVAYRDSRYGLIVDSVEDSVDVYKSQMTVIPKVMNDGANVEFRGDVSRILEYSKLDDKTDTLMVYSVESFLRKLAEAETLG